MSLVGSDVKKYLRKRFEVLLIKIAQKILVDRNVQRSAVVSRKDNNDMWAMSEKLEVIEKRMLNNYK
jgi:hypothetical protein